jgi:pimeloyl-ACP methyl ester carboxylesterase
VLTKPKIPVVFLPGLICDERLWRDQTRAISDIAASVIMDLTLDTSVEEMAQRVLTVAPPQFALAGLSMGGYVALEILRQAPERVTRVALLDTSAAPDTPARVQHRLASIEAVKYGRFAGVTPRLLSQLIHSSKINTAVGDDVRAMAVRVGREAFLRQQTAILNRPDSRGDLPQLRLPTLVGVGDSDVLTPPHDAEEIHAGIRDSILHVFPRCGHLPALEVPEETSRVLCEWLLR